MSGLDPAAVGLYTLAGFVLFLLLERLVQRHQHHGIGTHQKPLTYLILLGDGVHNLLGGLAIGAAFVTRQRRRSAEDFFAGARTEEHLFV
jgi:zinc and cadmium transporter